MNKQKTKLRVIAVCVAIAFISGCVPEDSLEWSGDGSVGLMRVQGSLYLVNGQSGELTEIEKDNVQPWPDISKDGNVIVYSKKVDCPNLSEGLKLIPPGQAKMVEYLAAKTAKAIIEQPGLVKGDSIPLPEQGPLAPPDYRNWVLRYLFENADPNLLKVLNADVIKNGKKKEISYFQIILVHRNDVSSKQIIATNMFATCATRLSPNGKLLAYLMHTQQGGTNTLGEYSLYLASLEGQISAMFIDHLVAIGYSWRNDSNAIAYWKANAKELSQDAILSELKEQVLYNTDGIFMAQPVAMNEEGSMKTHWCTGTSKQIAGSIFYPWMKVSYGPDGRIFFSSLKLILPSSSLDEVKWSLFCYDPLTESISDVLPISISANMIGSINAFALSPDAKNVLLPMENNRFAVYELGKLKTNIFLSEEEGFGGKETPKLAPSWKSCNDISCLVSGNSHFLRGNKTNKNQVIVIRNGKAEIILSKTWNLDILSHFE
jgi:hypothetical protein